MDLPDEVTGLAVVRFMLLTRAREDGTALFDQVHFHYPAADTASELAIASDGYLVSLSPGTAASALGYHKQHHQLVNSQPVIYELPQLEIFIH